VPALGRWRIVLVGALIPFAQCGGPASDPVPGTPPESQVSDTSIIAAQEALTPSVIDLPGVVGTAVGHCDGRPCIKVLLAGPSPDIVDRIPDTFRGFIVEIEIAGEIRARGDSAG